MNEVDQPNESKNESKSIFDGIRRVTEAGDEYWSARDLMAHLEYSEWRTFNDVIHRSIEAVEKVGGNVENHFVAGTKMVSIGYGNERAVKDYKLSRLASYVVAMNGDPAQKPRVAEAQNYFAQKTRLRELFESSERDIERLRERLKYRDSDRQLSEAITEAGISPRGLDQIKGSGDSTFFGGHDTDDMRKRYELPSEQPLADRMPTVLLSAKGLTNQMTKWKIENIGLIGVDAIDEQHQINSQSVRETLVDEGIVPEELPPEEDTKKIERRLKESRKLDLLGE